MWKQFISIPMTAALLCYFLGAQEFGRLGYYDHAVKELSNLPQKDWESSPSARAYGQSFRGRQPGGFAGFTTAYLGTWLLIGWMRPWRRKRPWIGFVAAPILGLVIGGIGGYVSGYLDSCCLRVF